MEHQPPPPPHPHSGPARPGGRGAGGPGPGLGALPAWTPAHRRHPCCRQLQAPGTKGLRLRKFPIELRAGTVMLEGWGRSFPSVRDLRAALQDCSLRAGDDCFPLRRCCLPRPGGTQMGAPRGNWGGGRPLPSVTALRDYSHPQRSPTSLSHGGLRPAPDSSTSVISASTESARKTSPRCVAGVGVGGGLGGLEGGMRLG